MVIHCASVKSSLGRRVIHDYAQMLLKPLYGLSIWFAIVGSMWRTLDILAYIYPLGLGVYLPRTK